MPPCRHARNIAQRHSTSTFSAKDWAARGRWRPRQGTNGFVPQNVATHRPKNGTVEDGTCFFGWLTCSLVSNDDNDKTSCYRAAVVLDNAMLAVFHLSLIISTIDDLDH